VQTWVNSSAAAIRLCSSPQLVLAGIPVLLHVVFAVFGQHHLLSQGPSEEYADYLLLGNRLEVDLVRDHDHVWLVRRNRAASRWSVRNTGAAAVQASH
jgi:hypothetical protein